MLYKFVFYFLLKDNYQQYIRHKILLKHNIKEIPVSKNGKIVGIIQLYDIGRI